MNSCDHNPYLYHDRPNSVGTNVDNNSYEKDKKMNMMDRVYYNIKTNIPEFDFIDLTMKWRDEKPGIIRKIAFGAILSTTGLCLIIEAVISLALAILTAPYELFNIHLAQSFAKRALLCLGVGGFSLTLAQWYNIVEPDFENKIEEVMG